ncbi:Ubiquitin-associated protein 2, partial [Lamprotornis superbus]
SRRETRHTRWYRQVSFIDQKAATYIQAIIRLIHIAKANLIIGSRAAIIPAPIATFFGCLVALKLVQLPFIALCCCLNFEYKDNILQFFVLALENRQQQQTQTAPVPPPGLESFSSQIPASAVEMPGSADVTGLNVQFGALEFGSEPMLTEFGSTSSSENTSQATNNSLYSKSVNDPLNTSLPISSTVQESTYTASAISSSSLTCSSQSTSPVTTSSHEQTSVLSRIVYQSSMAPSEPTPVAVTNGHSSVRTQATLDNTSSVPALKTEPSPSLPSAGSLPNMVSTTASLLPSTSQHTGTLPSLPQSSDLASSSLSQLSRY